MERAARKAGGRLRRDFGEVEQLQVSRKGPSDVVSKADQASERTLWDELRAARPDWGFVLEEGGTIEGDPTKPRWIIDPLDGTSNFLHGIPHFAISIAAQEPKLDGSGWGEVVAGLIYQPMTDETFWAEKARGAWLHDARLRVSGRRHLAEAAGRYDGFWESDLNAWDTAAGCLLVREAGGFVTDYRGRSLAICDAQVVAANDPLHSRLHKLVAGALRGRPELA